MKKFIILLVMLVLFVSCGTSRKLHQTKQEATVDSTVVQKVEKQNVEKVIDTTRTEHGKITITEIEFYPPPYDGQPIADDTKVVDSSKQAQPTANVDLQNVGNVKGSVKSIKQTVVESTVETKGESRETESQEQNKSNANVSRQETDTQKHEQPAPDPYRWRYVFYIGLLVVGVLLYLKRVPILNWIKKILAGIRRIF